MSANIEIKWNGKKFPVEFSSIKELEQTTVKELKRKCERITGVSAKDMKMNAFGALMNNEDMPLSVYGLRPGYHVTLKVDKNGHKKTASRDETSHRDRHHHQQQHHNHHLNTPGSKRSAAPPPLPTRPTAPTSAPPLSSPPQELLGEALLLQQLQKIQTKIDQDITPQVKEYEKTVKHFLNQPTKTEKEKNKQIYTGAHLGEQLMHVLFDLDNFTCGPTCLNARQARKEAVKSAQALLDKIDENKSIVKKESVVDTKN